MASFGASYPCFKGENDAVGFNFGKLVTANITVNLASGELYADDELTEQASEFSSGTLAMETDDMLDQYASKIYGCRVEDGSVIYNKNDTPPMGGLGYFKTLMRHGVKYYKGYYLPRVHAAIGNDNAQTKSNSITFTTETTTFTIFADDNGDWKENKTFSDINDVKAWIDSKLDVGTYFSVNVSSQGESTGESVGKVGESYVGEGEDFEIEITGTPTAVYDNGEDVTSSVSGGKYTISDVVANHTVAIIF